MNVKTSSKLLLALAVLSTGCAKVSGEKSNEMNETQFESSGHEHEDSFVFRNSETNEIGFSSDQPENLHEKYTYLTGSPRRWSGPIYWSYNPAGQPSIASTESIVNSLVAATQKWSQVCGVTFVYQGLSSAQPSTSSCNGTTVVGWGPLGGSTVGYTQACYNGSGYFTEFDLILDNESPLQINSLEMVQKTALHEFGHAFGLGHTDISPAVMTPMLSTGTPVSDDIEGCQSLYGASKLTSPPPTTTTTLRPVVVTTTTAPSASNWTFCANEGGTCSFSGTRSVRYGANGIYATKTVTGSTACTNNVFGDPISGVAKRCEFSNTTVTPPPTTTTLAPTGSAWTRCASEGGTCWLSGTRSVRYGANGSYLTKTVTGSVQCDNWTFGGDPAYGVQKSCEYSSTTAPTTTATWTDCASERSTCYVSGTREVRYGANGSYRTKVVSGSIACTNEAFGGDPAYGIQKTCQSSSIGL